jgi:hypothetical protein
MNGEVRMRGIVGILVGAGVGFAIGYFGKCSSGVCPLTRNPWISMGVGALLGWMLSRG